jgi:hypothetical protein
MISAGEAAQLRRDLLPPHWRACCKVCGTWMTNAPLSALWVQSRCSNRRCAAHGKAQTIRFPNGCGKVSA